MSLINFQSPYVTWGFLLIHCHLLSNDRVVFMFETSIVLYLCRAHKSPVSDSELEVVSFNLSYCYCHLDFLKTIFIQVQNLLFISYILHIYFLFHIETALSFMFWTFDFKVSCICFTVHGEYFTHVSLFVLSCWFCVKESLAWLKASSTKPDLVNL